MKIGAINDEHGNTLLAVLATILVISVIAANVLLNTVTRYNVSSGQVRGWKSALYAAEAGGDIAYAEVRKTILDPTQSFAGWDLSGSVHTSSEVVVGSDNTTTRSSVDCFYYDTLGNPWYRIRVRGTAPVLGLKRAGMDNRMESGVRGDSLLRKIDFNYDHFVAAYGANGDGVGKAIVPVSRPQITRRLELIAAPITPFEAAVKALNGFNGPGSAGVIDSYDSRNGAYAFVANNPSHPRYSDSHSGSVAVNAETFEMNQGPIYGNVSTNGGTVLPSSLIHGTIDNNVPFTVLPFKMPTTYSLPQSSPTKVTANVTITPPAAGTPTAPTFYLLSSLTDSLTIEPFESSNTYVAIRVTGDITDEKVSIRIKPLVYAKIFFDGNMNVKAREIVNDSNIASHLQFYAISPADAAQVQTIQIDPPGSLAATFYAPSADFSIHGNPDIFGAIVCKTFSSNGNTSVHYDRALSNEGTVIDYRIASYVEDLR